MGVIRVESGFSQIPNNQTKETQKSVDTSDKMATMPPNRKELTLRVLETWLFTAADKLRGPIDAADFKTYIFPLLFFKRICDVYDEEFQQALAKAGGDIEEAAFRENYRFTIPEACHWKDVREHTENVGYAITYAMRGIERANQSTLYEIFGDAQWTNRQRLSDELLRDMIEHFSMHNLSNSNVEPDVAGRAYEYLIKKFADESNKAAGEFYTPRAVVRLMTKILKPKQSENVYDPACGTGGMLLEAFNYVRLHEGNVNLLHLFGQEKNLTTSSIARMNLILHGLEDFAIVRGDTLRHPAFFEGDNLSTFDCVIANPPFSLKKWGKEIWENDPYGRNFAGTPPSAYGDYAWVQHMIKSMAKPNGRMALVLSQGALFRKEAESKIRKRLVEADLLEAVIGLGPNLFYGTPLAACILIFRADKGRERKGKVLFIDASNEYRKGRSQNELLGEHVERICSWYESFDSRPGISKTATLDEIRANDFSLNISLYVEQMAEEEKISLPEAFASFKEAAEHCEKAEQQLSELLKANRLIT
jgi:type I restriction enzyme M protein